LATELVNETNQSMSRLKFFCSHCGQHRQCDAQASGWEIQRPGLNHLISIPPRERETGQNPTVEKNEREPRLAL
jgi:hypothetical protein